jgi:hypothetical protein
LSFLWEMRGYLLEIEGKENHALFSNERKTILWGIGEGAYFMFMIPQQLLHIVESLYYKARLSFLIELGPLSVEDVATATLLTDLEHGDFYERFLSLQSCTAG